VAAKGQSLEMLLRRFYGDKEHPYRTYERTIRSHVKKSYVVLDAGCGRRAPIIINCLKITTTQQLHTSS